MTTLGYARAELLRTVRNRRLIVAALAFPLIFYGLIAVPNRHVEDFGGTGIPFVVYAMVGVASLGATMAAISCGIRIASERASGWTRQLRTTPLNGGAYVRAKLIPAFALALTCLLALFSFAAILGASLTRGEWLTMTGLMLVGLLPFAALGVVMGQVLNVDAVGAACGGLVSLLAFISGTWTPIAAHGFMHTLALGLPSYWLAQTSKVAGGGHAWSLTGWLVVATWTLVLTALARYAYRRDLGRT